jgi:hypothetical protein
MNRQEFSQQAVVTMLLTILLVGCGAPVATSARVESTAAPTRVPPMVTSTPVQSTAVATGVARTVTPTRVPPTATSPSIPLEVAAVPGTSTPGPGLCLYLYDDFSDSTSGWDRAQDESRSGGGGTPLS